MEQKLDNLEEIQLGHHASESFQEQLEAELKETQQETPEEQNTYSPEETDVSRETSEETSAQPEKAQESTTDDYGNPIEPAKKFYSEEEVNAKINEAIRDRLSRGKYAQEVQQPQTPQGFEYNENSSEDWQTQLEGFIENTLSKREQKMQYEQMRRQEEENQAHFEIRFNQGMSKYPDFEQVVLGKPLTPQMVLATRAMENPAAFIYAAAKTQSNELGRIAKMSDPYAQAVELGKLEERMRKVRSNVSQAPRPIDPVKGDIVDKKERTWNIDDKLRMAEKEAKDERMKGRKI